MASENRAAHALARNYPGGMAAFMPAMNAKARQLGMSSSHFVVEPTGLSSDNVASPEDLSKLVMAASKNATIRNTRPTRVTTYASAGGWWDSTTPTRWSTTRPGTSSSRKPATSKKPAAASVMQTVIEGRTIVIVLLNSFGKQ